MAIVFTLLLKTTQLIVELGSYLASSILWVMLFVRERESNMCEWELASVLESGARVSEL